MHRVLKTILLWLLMAALPIQGLAAVVKASCGQTHHVLTSTTVEPAVQFAAANLHSHSDGATLSHHAHKQATGAQVQTATDGDMDTPSAAPNVKSSHCSACATCCFGAVAPPTSALRTSEPGFSERALPSLTAWLAGYIPPTLERPPRHFPI